MIVFLWSIDDGIHYPRRNFHRNGPTMNRTDAGEQFGQRRPPLSVTIKQILDRYPDGQIFKVLLVVGNP